MCSSTRRGIFSKTRLFAPSYTKMIILPRQARDKHREGTQKDAFLQGCGAELCCGQSTARRLQLNGQLMGGAGAADEKTHSHHLRCQLILPKTPSFTKTGSGRT
jgi:hypothetical protein